MARTEISTTMVTEVVFTCEKTTCEVALTIHIPTYAADRFRALEFAEEDADMLGWSCWVNRGRRYYCPDHRPGKGRPGSENRKVWG